MIKKGKLCIPEKYIEKLFLELHPLGHPGAYKLLALGNRQFEFDINITKLLNTCLTITKRCALCQVVKPYRGRSQQTLDFSSIPNDIFASVCMDFLDLPRIEGEDGSIYDYALVQVCRLSGFTLEFAGGKTRLTANKFAKIYFERMNTFTGIHNKIVSENYHLISGTFFITICYLAGIDQYQSIFYRPRDTEEPRAE